MTMNYLPEGERIMRAENTECISSLKGLESAMLTGRTVEAVAVRCTSDMTLEFDLGGIRGFMPKQECTLPDADGTVKDIAVITRVGKPVCFKVINIYEENGVRCAALSRRIAQHECLEGYLYDLIPGDIIRCRVTHLEHFGAFVDVGCGVVSLLPIDSVSVSRISHPRDRFFIGEEIYAVIKSIDRDEARLCVTHKELLGSWEENACGFSVGQTVAGVVRSIEEYGIFVELAPNLAGLAEYRSGVKVGSCASVYIKSIFPERMKVKLVIVDTCDNMMPPARRYFTDVDKVLHIDRWRYSPDCCDRVIETVFGLS